MRNTIGASFLTTSFLLLNSSLAYAELVKQWDTSTTSFNGSSTYVSLDSDLDLVNSLTKGSIYSAFKATGTTGTLFSVSNANEASSEYALVIDGDGTLRIHARENGAFINNLKTTKAFNDNREHKTVVLTDENGTSILVDGELLAQNSSTSFLNSVDSLSSMNIGRNEDNGGGQWYFSGEISSTEIYSSILSKAEAALKTRPNNVVALFNGNLDASPDLLGWTNDSTLQGQGSLLDDNGDTVWQADGSAGKAEWEVIPDSQTNLDATNYGWSMSSTVKVLSGSYITNYYANGNKRYLVNLKIDSSGALVADVEGDAQYTLVSQQGSDQYHDYEVKYDASSQQATFWFDGEKVTSWSGSTSNQNVIVFGNGSSGTSGVANYKNVRFEVTDSTQPIALSSVFVGGAEGINGMSNYRIPSIVQSQDNTLLAFSEGRPNGADPGASGLINISLKRSLDLGKTWQPVQIIEESSQYDFSDPRPLVDESTNTIFVFYTQWLDLCAQNGNCTGPDDPNYLLFKSSTDNGQTWSNTVNVSDEVKDPTWRSINAGPGHGVQLKWQSSAQGSHNGRLIFPAIVRASDSLFYVVSVFSDDNGTSWDKGSLTPISGPTEADFVELNDGRILMTARNDGSAAGTRYHFLSNDGGITWQQTTHDLVVSKVDIGITRFSSTVQGDAENKILVSAPIGNPAGANRYDLGIWVSEDEGVSFNSPTQIVYGFSAYSDIITLSDGTIAVLYEATGSTHIKFINLNINAVN